MKNLNKEAIFLISTHDFTHKNVENLKEIMGFAKKLEREKKLSIH